ncbi:hypothetical protein [Mycolicibacterium goodii]|uniref:Uncharacterized protein n=1 Tax=Mycolicibacterium goodii TaxID=134601 RepID=A0A0K0XBE0_MYCGD|nr:hypothetical protein AFA91_25430 [Mycolicibacterium goodii]
MPEFEPLIAVLASGGVGLISTYLAGVLTRRKTESVPEIESEAEESLESRLATIAESLQQAAVLMALVQTEIDARAAKARQLADDVQKAEQLALLTVACQGDGTT